jgi:hypothetical protein
VTDAALAGYFRVAAAIAGVFAVIWGFRIGTQGSRAVLMSLAFLCLGATALLLANGQQTLANAGLGLTVLLLIVEFALRAKRQAEEESRK